MIFSNSKKRRMNVAEVVHGEEWLGTSGDINLALIHFEFHLSS